MHGLVLQHLKSCFSQPVPLASFKRQLERLSSHSSDELLHCSQGCGGGGGGLPLKVLMRKGVLIHIQMLQRIHVHSHLAYLSELPQVQTYRDKNRL